MQPVSLHMLACVYGVITCLSITGCRDRRVIHARDKYGIDLTTSNMLCEVGANSLSGNYVEVYIGADVYRCGHSTFTAATALVEYLKNKNSMYNIRAVRVSYSKAVEGIDYAPLKVFCLSNNFDLFCQKFVCNGIVQKTDSLFNVSTPEDRLIWLIKASR